MRAPLTSFLLQVSMALYGYDIPYRKTPTDVDRRSIVFAIIEPYCFSNAELKELREYPPHIIEMWLQTFTNTQNVMVRSKLLISTKEWFLKFFPSQGLSPNLAQGQQIGIAPGQTILDRYNV